MLSFNGLILCRSFIFTPSTSMPNTQQGPLPWTLQCCSSLTMGVSVWHQGYGRWCWPWVASWLPGGRSWCDWGNPCWARIWFCCWRCSWGVSWGFGGSAWCPCGCTSCIIWLSTAWISGSAFPSTETQMEVWSSRFLPVDNLWNIYFFKNFTILTDNLLRGFHFLWFQALHVFNRL